MNNNRKTLTVYTKRLSTPDRKLVYTRNIVDIGLLVEKLACCEICANCNQWAFHFDSTLYLAYFYPFSVAIIGLAGV